MESELAPILNLPFLFFPTSLSIVSSGFNELNILLAHLKGFVLNGFVLLLIFCESLVLAFVFIGFWVVLVGFWDVLIGFWDVLIGFFVVLVGFCVFLVGFWVLLVGVCVFLVVDVFLFGIILVGVSIALVGIFL